MAIAEHSMFEIVYMQAIIPFKIPSLPSHPKKTVHILFSDSIDQSFMNGNQLQSLVYKPSYA